RVWEAGSAWSGNTYGSRTVSLLRRKGWVVRTLLITLLLLAGSVGLARGDDLSDRSKTVCVALEKQLNKKSSEITKTDLATVTELKLPHIHLPCFKENDFAGMPKLKKLYFYSLFHKSGEANEVAAFNEKVFAKLSDLEELIIESDQLGNLPDDAFDGLKSLKV